MPRDLSSLMERAWAQDPDARPSFADICKELQATTPRRPSSISRPWSASSPTAGDAPPPASVASGQGSSRSLASSVMNMFRAAQSDEAASKSPADAQPAQQSTAPRAQEVEDSVRARGSHRPTATASRRARDGEDGRFDLDIPQREAAPAARRPVARVGVAERHLERNLEAADAAELGLLPLRRRRSAAAADGERSGERRAASRVRQSRH